MKKGNIILIGMPGSGKTTIGTELSEKIKEAFNKYSNLFMNNHHDYVSKVFVKSVGEDIREPVYNDNGEPLRDANGGYVKKVVGRNDSVAVFKVTFSSGHSIMIKVRNRSFGHLRPNSYI